jgi:hypothetical protein
VTVPQAASGDQPRYRIGWRKGHAYLYERIYEGPIAAHRPRHSEIYLGRVDDERSRAKPSQSEMRMMALSIVRRRAGAKGGAARRGSAGSEETGGSKCTT